MQHVFTTLTENRTHHALLATCLCFSLMIMAGCGKQETPRQVVNNVPAPPINQPPVIKVQPKVEKQAEKSTSDHPHATQSVLSAEEAANAVVVHGPGQVMEVISLTTPVPESDKFTLTVSSSKLRAEDFSLVEKPAITPLTEKIELPAGFIALEEFGAAEDGYPLKLQCERDGSHMVYIPAGQSFLGGYGTAPANTQPEMELFLDRFYIDQYEATVGQVHLFQEDLKSKKRNAPRFANETDPENHPALGLSLPNITSFLKWTGKELPTEAEFEKAGRGPEGFRTPWGNGPAFGYPQNIDPETVFPIGSHLSDQSIYGVFDLAANAQEWVSDWYSQEGHAEAKASKFSLQNWTGAKKANPANFKVVKGGGPNWSLWNRQGVDIQTKSHKFGFRGVLKLPTAKKT